jgi:hypothetical protein
LIVIDVTNTVLTWHEGWKLIAEQMIKIVDATYIFNVEDLHIGFCDGSFFFSCIYIFTTVTRIFTIVDNMNSAKYMPAFNYFEIKILSRSSLGTLHRYCRPFCIVSQAPVLFCTRIKIINFDSVAFIFINFQ